MKLSPYSGTLKKTNLQEWLVFDVKNLSANAQNHVSIDYFYNYKDYKNCFYSQRKISQVCVPNSLKKSVSTDLKKNKFDFLNDKYNSTPRVYDLPLPLLKNRPKKKIYKPVKQSNLFIKVNKCMRNIIQHNLSNYHKANIQKIRKSYESNKHTQQIYLETFLFSPSFFDNSGTSN
ncbi:hypothetical protein A3Q56_07301 [Intoshia linei]|uniref:Uncharacterized protein n=1 Tax=Intoshia linei TaxID=1819745 RepID=A0A177AUS6_9BILA|nr:hypothetical protein A3Q56_07301 [Intoshia linei]